MLSYEETTAVALATDVYRESNRPPLPEDVTLYLDCPDEYQKDGYFQAGYSIIVVNAEIDAINTCMKTSINNNGEYS